MGTLALVGLLALELLTTSGVEPPAGHLAVAIPFHVSQYNTKLLPSLQRWLDPQFQPCSLLGRHGAPRYTQAGRNATLVFVYTLDRESLGLRAKLEGLFGQLGRATRCFAGGMRVVAVDLPAQNDRYSDAPCVIFFGMMDQLRDAGEFDHVYQMETDVRPVRANWLDAVMDEATQPQPCRRFWQRGSMAHCQTYQGRLAQRQDFHINGNSIWCLRDPGLWEYLERVKAFYPPGVHSGVAGCGTNRWAETGVDHAIYQFRQQPANFEYSRSVWHKFQYTKTVLNKCEDRYTVPDIRRDYPGTFLVHSKAPFLSPGILTARELVVAINKRWPEGDEQERLASKAALFGWNRLQLAAYLCEQPEHIARAMARVPAPLCQEICYKHQHYFADVVRSSYYLVCKHAVLKKAWLGWELEKTYLWSVDFDPGPLSHNLPVLKKAGALVHAEVDSRSCVEPSDRLCRERLKVLRYDEGRGISLDPCPNHLRKRFFEAYKNDPEFERVDGFICSYPAANCELFMPFNRSLIVYFTTRLEFGRADDMVEWRKPYISQRTASRSEQWLRNLQRIAANPMNTVAASSHYEVHAVACMSLTM